MTVEFKVELPFSLDKVFLIVSNPLNDHFWKQRVTVSFLAANTGIGKGTKFVQRTRFLFKLIVITYQITEFEKNKYFTIESLDAPFKITQTITFKNVKEYKTCKLNLLINEEVKRSFKYTDMVLGWFLKRALIRDYKQLTTLLTEMK